MQGERGIKKVGKFLLEMTCNAGEIELELSSLKSTPSDSYLYDGIIKGKFLDEKLSGIFYDTKSLYHYLRKQNQLTFDQTTKRLGFTITQHLPDHRFIKRKCEVAMRRVFLSEAQLERIKQAKQQNLHNLNQHLDLMIQSLQLSHDQLSRQQANLEKEKSMLCSENENFIKRFGIIDLTEGGNSRLLSNSSDFSLNSGCISDPKILNNLSQIILQEILNQQKDKQPVQLLSDQQPSHHILAQIANETLVIGDGSIEIEGDSYKVIGEKIASLSHNVTALSIHYYSKNKKQQFQMKQLNCDAGIGNFEIRSQGKSQNYSLQTTKDFQGTGIIQLSQRQQLLVEVVKYMTDAIASSPYLLKTKSIILKHNHNLYNSIKVFPQLVKTLNSLPCLSRMQVVYPRANAGSKTKKNWFSDLKEQIQKKFSSY